MSENPLQRLAGILRDEDSLISADVQDPTATAEFGAIAAAGPRAQKAPAEYALLIEAIREGYLLHYGEPRVVVPADRNLALLAGDYLYALGLERLAALGDPEAVRELSDLISLSAQLHAEGRGDTEAEGLWRACVAAVAEGPSDAHERIKSELRGPPAEAEG